MTKDQDSHPAPAFNDPRNVTVGKARVIWAKACGRHPEGYVLPGGRHPEGYVLPGGHRTQNRMTAQHAAELMHRMMLAGRY